MIQIAAILTCFNRREKTILCLKSLFEALDNYNEGCPNREIDITVFLTDDGCTDGTTAAILSEFSNKLQKIHILKGTGGLFWAGGMRFAWSTALKYKNDWDFFLLLNDDVALLPNCIYELMCTHEFSLKHKGKAGLYSGITYSTTEPHVLTYSGCIWLNKTTGKMKMLGEADVPQLCDVTNANILLVDRSVYEKIGIFYDGFIHGGADHDYSFQANKSGFPVWVTASCCGFCDNDHDSLQEEKQKLLSMSFKERYKYFHSPVHSIQDYIIGTKRRAPQRWIIAAIGRYMNLYCPHIYYFLSDLRYRL